MPPRDLGGGSYEFSWKTFRYTNHNFSAKKTLCISFFRRNTCFLPLPNNKGFAAADITGWSSPPSQTSLPNLNAGQFGKKYDFSTAKSGNLNISSIHTPWPKKSLTELSGIYWEAKIFHYICHFGSLSVNWAIFGFILGLLGHLELLVDGKW